MNERDWWDALLRKKYTLGRKFCTKCGKWRPIHDFHADTRPSKRHPSGRPAHLRPSCIPCNRKRIRVERGYNASLTGIGGQPRVYKSSREKNRAQRARDMKNSVTRKKRRDLRRFEAKERRRAIGIPPRNFKDGRNREEVEYWNSRHPDNPV